MSDDNYWKFKYLKYKRKINNINQSLQIGGENYDDKKKYLKTLLKIKEGLKTKGYVFWFDSQGKVIVQGLDTKSAKSKMIKLIVADKNKWKNEIVTELVIEFDPKNIMDEDSGGLSISVDLNKIVLNDDKLSINSYIAPFAATSPCHGAGGTR